MTHPHERALEAALRAAISDSDASDLAKRMNGGWSAQAALERAMRDAIPEAIVAYLAAMPPPVSPELIAKLNKLASRLTQMGEYEACDLIDTVVARVSAMPGRELLAEALEALDGMLFFVGELPGAQYSAHVHAARAAADKIRAAMTQEKQT